VGARSLTWKLAAALLAASCGGGATTYTPALRPHGAQREKVVADFEAAVTANKDAYVALFDFAAVGEYEILIFSAKLSDGLETWLSENGYRLPAGASAALRPYVRQDNGAATGSRRYGSSCSA